jgi:hypothetical protein
VTLVGNRMRLSSSFFFTHIRRTTESVTHLAFEETRILHKNYSVIFFFLRIAVNAAVILAT